MGLKVWAAALMAVLVAALPSVGSLCELRCASHGIPVEDPSEQQTTADCSGHGTEPQEMPSGHSESGHDCGEHALLAKGGGVGFQPHLARNLVVTAGVSTASGFLNNASGHPATLSISTDLSPPFGRRPGILRL